MQRRLGGEGTVLLIVRPPRSLLSFIVVDSASCNGSSSGRGRASERVRCDATLAFTVRELIFASPISLRLLGKSLLL